MRFESDISAHCDSEALAHGEAEADTLTVELSVVPDLGECVKELCVLVSRNADTSILD